MTSAPGEVNVNVLVQPAGMTYERAMSIAMAVDAKAHGILVTPEEAAQRWTIKRQAQSASAAAGQAAAADKARSLIAAAVMARTGKIAGGTPEQRLEVSRLTDDGYNDKEIGERLGIPRKTIGRWRKALGIPAQPITRNHNRELHAAILDGYRKGLTDAQIAELQGIPRQRLAQARIRYGIPCNKAIG